VHIVLFVCAEWYYMFFVSATKKYVSVKKEDLL